MAEALADTPAREWRDSWMVVLAGVAGGSLATLHLYSTGVLIGPLEREFGWTRVQISSGLTITAMSAVLLSPLIGMTIDRIGARRVALFGASLFCLVFAMLSQVTSLWMWWILWGGIAVAAACIAPAVWAAGTTSLFTRARGMALAVTLCGTSIGALVVPMATHLLIERVGWRGAYLGLAGAWGLITLPLVWFCFSSALDRRRGESPREATAIQRAKPLRSLRGTVLSWRFVKLVLAAVSIVTVASSFLANIVPMLLAEGYATGPASAIAGLIGLGSLTGRLCGGYFLDRIDGRFVGAVSVLMPVATCLILLTIPASAVAVSIGAFSLGLAVGVEWDAVAYLASRHFGIASFGTVFGTLTGLSLLLNGLGPTLTNYVYDQTGAYRLALWCFIPLCLVSCVMFLLLGPYPALDEEVERHADRGRQG